MLLSARMINNVGSVNAFEWAQEVEFTAGDTQDVYFQLVDASVDKATQGFKPGGRRYAPAAGAIHCQGRRVTGAGVSAPRPAAGRERFGSRAARRTRADSRSPRATPCG